MSLLPNLGILALVVGLLVTGYILVKQKINENTSTWKEKLWSAAALGIGAIALLLMIASVWPFFSEVAELATAQILNINPIAAAFFLFGLCLLGIWLPLGLMIYGLRTAWGGANWLKYVPSLIKVVGFFLSIFCFLHFSGIVSEYDKEWMWALRFTLVLVAIVAGYFSIRWWYRTGQNHLAIFITYALCAFCTGYLASTFGWSTTANIMGSIYSLSFALVLNLFIFWLFVGLVVDPDKSFRRSLGFYLLMPWAFGLMIFSGYVLHLQATGQVTWHELEVSRVATQVNQKYEELLRARAAQDLPELKRRFQEAVEAGDAETAKKLKKKINNKVSSQEEISHAEANPPDAIKQTLASVKKFNPFGGEEAKEEQPRPPRDTQWNRIKVTEEEKELIRVYEGDRFLYNSPSGFWVIDSTGKKYYHNPSAESGEIRSFEFYNTNKGGEKIFIKAPSGQDGFQLSYRVVSRSAH